MAGTDASEGQALWQPGGAEEDSRLREDNRHLHLAYDDEKEEEDVQPHQHCYYFEDNVRVTAEIRVRALMGLLERYGATFNGNRN